LVGGRKQSPHAASVRAADALKEKCRSEARIVSTPAANLGFGRTGPAQAFPRSAGEVLPWIDQPAPIPPPAQNVVGHPLVWESLDSRLTPNAEFFTVKHYSGVGNARWTGTPLHSLLRQADPADEGTEVVFWGADRGPVTIRDNSGITGAGNTGITEPDAGGGLDLTITEQFARSMSLSEAMAPDNLLCFEMNGEPLPREHGYPVRLIAPGWYGVANVKWLTRIEVTDQRYAGRFMARDYVTIREEQFGGQTVWTFHTVSHARLKSAPAKVTRRGDRHTISVPPGARPSPEWRCRSTAAAGKP
jgi:DMSO/TMAO reductase YedYZ molybdopterin-dependent catalytic subunit